MRGLAVELPSGTTAAVVEAVMGWSRVSWPLSTASSTRREVMILVMEAGYIFS